MGDDLSEEAEEEWCAEQRNLVVAYLVKQGLAAPNVGEWPAWHIAPVIAVWAVESQSRPDWVGWWAISGDVPTDYTTCGEERHPREALRDIGHRWSEEAAAQDDQLASLLKARGMLLVEWADDDNIWLD
jgi:hypothetical protein